VLRLQRAGLFFGFIALISLVPLYPDAVSLRVLLAFIGIYVAFVLVYLIRRILSYRFHAVFLTGAFALMGALLVAMRGVPDLGIAVLVVTPVIALILINRLAAVIAVICVLIYIGLIGVLAQNGVLDTYLNYQGYIASWSNWLSILAGTLFVSVVAIVVVDGVNRQLLKSIKTLDKQALETGEINRKLKDEMSERVLIEKELLVKASAVESALNAIAFADLDGKFTYANKSYLELWRCNSMDDIIGKPVTKHWVNQQEADRTMEEIKNSGHSQGVQEARRQDGTTFISQFSATLIRDKDGQPICMMGILDDITEHILLKDELIEEMAWRKVIQEAGNLLRSQLEIDGGSFKSVVIALRKLVPVDSMMIVLHQGDQAVFEVVETSNDESAKIKVSSSVPFAGSFLEHMKKHGHPVLIEELNNQCNFPEDMIIHGGEFRSCIRMPLYCAGEFLGMLALTSHKPRAFVASHIQHLEALALQIAHTVASLQRYRQVRSESERLTLIVREVHHRIKNNLQGIVGLLDNHIKKEPQLASVLNSAIGQLYSVAEVHNLLSHHAHETVNWHSLIQGVCKATSALCPHQLQNVLPLETANVKVASSEAVAMALTLNELIQNAINHGYPDGRTGTIRVSVEDKRDTSSINLIVANDGVAPVPTLETDTGKGFGLGLNLVKSLLPTDARIRIRQRDNWTVAEVSLPDHTFFGAGEL